MPAGRAVTNIRALGAKQPHPSTGRTRPLATPHASLLPNQNKPVISSLELIAFCEPLYLAHLASEPTRLLHLLRDSVRTRACCS